MMIIVEVRRNGQNSWLHNLPSLKALQVNTQTERMELLDKLHQNKYGIGLREYMRSLPVSPLTARERRGERETKYKKIELEVKDHE
ncbi:hypothetical protein AOC36_09605 [Erysipelothrix larvae]|uniref:Uncharacterized protein n=1 Tax=Erysipelothrix larvae TaxID=1514105 RepID=A0A109UHG0_9FIRM|nr:hypothetical protein [Erysipelothrix larvae]AMC94228.1 hypothetical protein AOC36_09605 [Erysipelothrix larvae]